VAGFPGWQQAVLRRIGAPVTPNNLRALDAWQRAEGGNARFNPLNTTQPMPGATNYNPVGVKNYINPNQGTGATVKTLLNGRYDHIVTGLRKNSSPVEVARAVAASPWGTGAGVLRVLGAGGVTPQATESSPPPAAAPSASVSRVPTVSPPKLNIGALSAGLGDIAMGAQPTEVLGGTSQMLLGQLLNPSRLRHSSLSDVQSPSFDTRGHPTTQSSQTLDPGGGWGGSYAPATQVAKVGEHYGLVPTSEKRDTKMTSSGNTSDHWVGSKNSYAYDLGGTVSQMDRAAKAITQRLGIPYKGGPLVATVTRNGLRYQVLYRTNVGGNHFNHIHIGVRRVG
jgi:hypothetical protein